MIENDLFIFLLDVGINPSACRGGWEPCLGVGTKSGRPHHADGPGLNRQWDVFTFNQAMKASAMALSWRAISENSRFKSNVFTLMRFPLIMYV